MYVPANPRVLIVAYGNPLRCDDGIGWHAAAILRQRLDPAQVRVICVHQLTPELSQTASHSDFVIFLDAACDGAPGTIHCSEIHARQVRAFAGNVAISHILSPEQVIALGEELYGHAPRACALSLAGECFDHGEALSPALAGCIDALVEVVLEKIVETAGRAACLLPHCDASH